MPVCSTDRLERVPLGVYRDHPRIVPTVPLPSLSADLTTAWSDDHKVKVATVTFPKIDPESRDAKMVALLASELGANPGNWQETDDGPEGELPSTRFTAARFLAYRLSQQHRRALPEDSYRTFFDTGEVSAALAATLIARYKDKQSAGQWVPPLGSL